MRDYLVFVRAGRHSLHREMIDADPARNWDCCVNAWAGPSPADAADPDVEIFQDDSINKFEAFLAYSASHPEARAYRRVLMLDDDLRFGPGEVSRFFQICERHSLFLAQPAIAWGSHANHRINIRNPACVVRRVNFVEVMAPCFSRGALDELMASTFALTKCTWGIDYAWSSLLRDRGRFAIVDAIAMAHTKPMDRSGGPFYEMLRRRSIEPEQELAWVHACFAPWGEMATLAGGHRYRWPLPATLNERWVAWSETRKLAAHLRRGGTIVPSRPVGAFAPATHVFATS
jgi:hypothetical protein